MGWDYTEGMTVRELKKDLRESTERAGYKQLAEATRRNVWYRVLESPKGDRFVAVYLTERRKKYGAGYKSMDEDMGPCYYDCPIEFLELAVRRPEFQSKYSVEWRKRVREVTMASEALRDQAARSHPIAIFAQ